MYMYVWTILIFLNINYVVIELIIIWHYLKLRYGINSSCGHLRVRIRISVWVCLCVMRWIRSLNCSHLYSQYPHLNASIFLLDVRQCWYETRAPRGTDRSPEYNEHFCYKLYSRVKNLTTEWNEKQQHFITHADQLIWAMGSPPYLIWIQCF